MVKYAERKVCHDVRLQIKWGVANHCPDFASSFVNGPMWPKRREKVGGRRREKYLGGYESSPDKRCFWEMSVDDATVQRQDRHTSGRQFP